VSETTEGAETTAPPRQWQVRAACAQYRRAKVEGRQISVWVMTAAHQGAVIREDQIHPDDLAHLLRLELTPAHGGGPFLEELPAS
jgi:hypothetical protein